MLPLQIRQGHFYMYCFVTFYDVMGKLLFIVEDEEKMAELGRELKQEKQKRKELDSKFSQIQEEFADMKSTNETLQKV